MFRASTRSEIVAETTIFFSPFRWSNVWCIVDGLCMCMCECVNCVQQIQTWTDIYNCEYASTRARACLSPQLNNSISCYVQLAISCAELHLIYELQGIKLPTISEECLWSLNGCRRRAIFMKCEPTWPADRPTDLINHIHSLNFSCFQWQPAVYTAHNSMKLHRLQQCCVRVWCVRGRLVVCPFVSMSDAHGHHYGHHTLDSMYEERAQSRRWCIKIHMFLVLVQCVTPWMGRSNASRHVCLRQSFVD